MSEAGGQRTGGFALAEREKRALTAIARRLPRWVLPDDLTFIGIGSAAAIGACLWASSLSRWWLVAIVPLLVVHWLGDSLDGTLARVRQITRPRYGYYLDHLVDAFATTLIGLGFGLSPYLHLPVALFAVVTYLILSINVYLEAEVLGRFQIGYAQLGPTELRILLAILTAVLFFTGPLPVTLAGATLPVLDWLVLTLSLLALVLVIVRGRKNLRELAVDEPAASRQRVEQDNHVAE